MGCNESKMVQVSQGQNSSSNKPSGNGQMKQANGQSKPHSNGTTHASKSMNAAHHGSKVPVKLSHFNDKGRCEPLLMLMANCGMEFENHVVEFKDWPALKPKTPCGTLPVMMVGSEELTSSTAILKYLGGVNGLLGCDSAEQAKVDEVINMIEDVRTALFPLRFSIHMKKITEEERKVKAKEFCEGPLSNLSQYLDKNMTGSKWIVSQLTTADFWLYGTMTAICDSLVPEAWTLMCPKILAWRMNFEYIPKIHEHIFGTKVPLKLTCFNDRGRCEPLKMIMAYADREYHNDIVAFDNWPNVKPTTPMGTLPVMKVGCDEIVTSLAMLAYLGGESGLEGCNAQETAKAQEMVNMIEEARSALFGPRFLIMSGKMDEATKQKTEKEFVEGKLSPLCKYLESNITGDKCLLSKLTTADFWLYGTLAAIADSVVPSVWSKVGPKVQKWRKHFECIPQIAKYIKNEPITFTYFNLRGRCEPYRMIMAYAGLNAVQNKITFDEWPALKPKTPMGYLPVLRVGDAEITTSLPILKYLGAETGLNGSCGEEEACCDQMNYVLEDTRSAVFPNRFLLRSGKMDDETKEVKAKEIIEGPLQKMIDYVEKHITGDKYLFPCLTTADFWLCGTMEIIEDSLVPDVWSRMGAKAQNWRKNFEAIPKVKEYRESRPTDYSL